MGQQQTVAGSALRRILLVLAVAALMSAMLVAMAAPAFAKFNFNPHFGGGVGGESGTGVDTGVSGQSVPGKGGQGCGPSVPFGFHCNGSS